MTRCRVPIVAAALLVLLALPPGVSAAANDCADTLSELDGYRVQAVQFVNPLSFIAPWASPFSSLERTLAIRTGQPFSVDGLNRDVMFLRRSLEAGGADSAQVFKLAYVRSCVFDRDPDARTLRVSYTMFTNVVSALVAPSLEESANESNRPATTGAARGVANWMSVVPLTGYNATRRTFGGVGFSTTTPGLRVDGETRASGNSLTGRVDVSGMIVPPSTRWQGGELTAAFDYLDTPAGSVHARQGTLAARFSESTKELTNQRVVFRYGGAIEGGQQYGSLKLYAGATGRRGHSAFTSSYGFQIGTTFADGVPSFSKQLFDVGFMTRVTGAALADGTDPFRGPLTAGVHRSLDLQTRFTAGVLENSAATPIVERFLGGNQVRPFVSDDSWVIQSDAFIRSIPENTLATAPGFSGGDRFYSANVTVAWPLWGRPLLPAELADAQFLKNLNGGFATIVGTLADNYKAKDPEYQRKAAAIPLHARAIRSALDAAAAALQRIPADKAKQQPLAKALRDAQGDIRKVKSSITLIDGGDLSVSAGLVNFYLPSLDTHVELLERQLAAAELGEVGSEVAASLDGMASPRDAITHILGEVDSSLYRQRAADTLAPAHRVLDVFLHELNIYSIAPVAIFDAARISPSGVGTRYGVGGGVRFSLVNVNFSTSYVFNVHRVASESPGAFLFQLDVTNVFP